MLFKGITITAEGDSAFADTNSVHVAQGAALKISAAGGDVVLSLSPDLVAALSPPPQDSVTVAAGSHVMYKFTTSNPGAYGIFYGVAGATDHPDFPADQSTDVGLWASAPPPPPPPPPPPDQRSKGGSGPTLIPQGSGNAVDS